MKRKVLPSPEATAIAYFSFILVDKWKIESVFSSGWFMSPSNMMQPPLCILLYFLLIMWSHLSFTEGIGLCFSDMASGGKKIPPGLTNWFCSFFVFHYFFKCLEFTLFSSRSLYICSQLQILQVRFCFINKLGCGNAYNLFFHSQKSLLCCYVCHQILPLTHSTDAFLIALPNCIQCIEMCSNFFLSLPTMILPWRVVRLSFALVFICLLMAVMDGKPMNSNNPGINAWEEIRRILNIGPGDKNDQEDWLRRKQKT